MASSSCSLLLSADNLGQKESELQEKLESRDDEIKFEGLKLLVANMVNGESYPKQVMTVIKSCLHSESHAIQKLLMVYWDIVEKKGKDGHLLHEMILVCNALKKNLNHANEFVRGSTLRFLTRIKEAEILESLVPSITSNLSHRHSYVRKNAVFTVFSVYESHPELIPDAPDLLETFLQEEQNPSAKRNAFLVLSKCAPQKALVFLTSQLSNITSLSENIQLSACELMRRISRTDPTVKAQFIVPLQALVTSSNHAIAFEAANTLVALYTGATAASAAVSAYCRLLQAESDHNVKMVILSRLASLQNKHIKVLQDMILDILVALNTPNNEIRKRALDLALSLLSTQNVNDFVSLMKRELQKGEQEDSGQAKNDTYKKMCLETLRSCSLKFPEVANQVVSLLLPYLSDDSLQVSASVALYIRDLVREFPGLREDLLLRVCETFDEIKSSEVLRVLIWMLGEYVDASAASLLELTIQNLRTSLGPLPLMSAQDEASSSLAVSSTQDEVKKPVVLADGTYATQSAVLGPSSSSLPLSSESKPKGLRSFLLNGEFFLGSTLAHTFTKLALRLGKIVGYGSPTSNQIIAEAMLLCVSLLRLGNQSQVSNSSSSSSSFRSIDADSQHRILAAIRLLGSPDSKTTQQAVFGLDQSSKACSILQEYLAARADNNDKLQQQQQTKGFKIIKQVDDSISFRCLKKGNHLLDDEDQIEDDEAILQKALKGSSSAASLFSAPTFPSATSDSSRSTSSPSSCNRLQRVWQLTGFADAVYAEAQITVANFDILVDLLLINQTPQLLPNLQVELATSGDLKLMEKPQSTNLAPFQVFKTSATIKVTSTESSVIFGNIVFGSASGTQQTLIVLNNLHLDVMEFILPASCTEVQYRSMWSEFEWENKVAVNTEINDLQTYVNHIISITNMKLLTPSKALEGDSHYLAANLYAKSMFGEDALLNISIEKLKTTGKIYGYIRIRAKTQGIALSLGDKITSKQRNIS